MLNNPVFFYIASVGIILFALLSLFAKNVIYSLLWAILVFFFGAVIFFILGSEYNAIIQAAVYGLAVPIIIGISIMFRGKPKKDESDTKKFILPYITIPATHAASRLNVIPKLSEMEYKDRTT